MGKAGGAPGVSHASCQAERNCRLNFPVRYLERTVSREVAATSLSRNTSEVSESVVVSHTEPVHAPAAPIAIIPAICLPVMIPPAASTGTLRIFDIAAITSGKNTT